MSTSTVRIDPADPGRAASAAAALATLPLSYTEGGDDAEVVVIAGSDGWVERVRAAATRGARGVIVTDPLPEAEAIDLAADPPDCFVVLAEPWASSPALRSTAEQFGAPISRAHLVDARAVEPVSGRSLRTVLFSQLRAVQNLGMEIASLSIAAESSSSILGVGRSVSGTRVVLSAARTDVGDGTLDILLVGRDETIRVELPNSTTARPGRAVLTSAIAAVEVPTTWETAHRSSWLALRDAFATGVQPGHVETFAQAISLVDAAQR
ncbi:hypothetical protein [Herbiconiux sp. UC225_62]|uniref:hypothetical protein n=1 Tax=Herbiconiux sp. UC225_62 TaxID=3350168 RepID=UPI0036D3E495